MELVGFRSRHAVYRLMNRLIAKGLVIKDPQGKLIPTNSNGIAILGVVEAKLKGQPVITTLPLTLVIFYANSEL